MRISHLTPAFFATFSSSVTSSPITQRTTPPPSQVQPYPLASKSPYHLLLNASGPTFFPAFDAFTSTDPTAGAVRYLSKPDAIQSELLGYVVDEGSHASLAYVGVDAHAVAPPGGRASVRLESKQRLSVGSVLVADVARMPTGCGVWPALWLLGEGEDGMVWPAGGEVDVIETVHADAGNHVTLHTSPGCTVDGGEGLFLGNLTSKDCHAGQGQEGCSVQADPVVTLKMNGGSCEHATAGGAFNAQGGGVYVMVSDDSGIAVYLFPRESLPQDLRNGQPEPSTWTGVQPLARFRGSGCNFAQSFKNMKLIINTDFCGSWAGAQDVWESSGCAAQTRSTTCDEYVANNPSAFKDVSWMFNSIQMYASNNSTSSSH